VLFGRLAGMFKNPYFLLHATEEKKEHAFGVLG
jgi:hypothetical protein